MARQSHLRKIADDWPIIFALVVAGWFAIASVGAHGVSLGNDDATADAKSDSSTTAASGSASSPNSSAAKPDPVVAGPLKIKIVAFSVKPNKKDLSSADAKLTLELSDTTKQNVSFYPSQITLTNVDTGTISKPKNDVVQGVSPNLSVTAPVDFQVALDPAATYQLNYAGKTLYTGMAF